MRGLDGLKGAPGCNRNARRGRGTALPKPRGAVPMKRNLILTGIPALYGIFAIVKWAAWKCATLIGPHI